MELNMGSCGFCGKTMMIESSGKLEETEANYMATQRCDCEAAEKERCLKHACETVNMLFEKSARSYTLACESPETISLISRLIEAVYDDEISDCVVTLMCGDKAKIFKKNGTVKVTRTHKVEQTKDVK